MTRLASAFAKPHPALVCFLTAGDGDTAANLDALVAGGADVIELGMPFTDPLPHFASVIPMFRWC